MECNASAFLSRHGCVHCRKLLYLVLVVALFVGIVGVIVWLYIDFGDCPLNQFFISETMIMGVIYTMMSMYHKINKGLITPFIVWAYVLSRQQRFGNRLPALTVSLEGYSTKAERC